LIVSIAFWIASVGAATAAWGGGSGFAIVVAAGSVGRIAVVDAISPMPRAGTSGGPRGQPALPAAGLILKRLAQLIDLFLLLDNQSFQVIQVRGCVRGQTMPVAIKNRRKDFFMVVVERLSLVAFKERAFQARFENSSIRHSDRITKRLRFDDSLVAKQ
jgi:hypothetical protein